MRNQHTRTHTHTALPCMSHFLKARIAPTPSGYLHKGNLVAFLLQKEIALRHGAQLGLRIDDLDRERYRESYLEDIFQCLKALNIQPDFGPKDAIDFKLHYRQELRLECYMEVLQLLNEKHLLYACECSRSEIDTHPGKGCPRYCKEKQLPLETSNTILRLNCATDAEVQWQDGFLGHVKINITEAMGDVVIRRRDGLPAYQITSLTDDHNMNIGLIVRGQDLLHSTAVQLYISEQLWGKQYTIYYHHPLIIDAKGEKLSKSAGASAEPMKIEERLLNELLKESAHLTDLIL